MTIQLKPVATVKVGRLSPIDDHWGDLIAEITLADNIPTEAFNNIETFSHLEIIYYFDKVNADKIIFSGHPRENQAWPNSGIFAQRKKDRPNQLGLCTVQLLEHKGRTIKVKYLDAIDGTPVLDIKPVMKQFEPKGEIQQPQWVNELMANYW